MQLRALAFATTLSRGIIGSMDKLEAALVAALPPLANGIMADDVEAGKPPLPLPESLDSAKPPAMPTGMGKPAPRGLGYYFGFLVMPLKVRQNGLPSLSPQL